VGFPCGWCVPRQPAGFSLVSSVTWGEVSAVSWRSQPTALVALAARVRCVLRLMGAGRPERSAWRGSESCSSARHVRGAPIRWGEVRLAPDADAGTHPAAWMRGSDPCPRYVRHGGGGGSRFPRRVWSEAAVWCGCGNSHGPLVGGWAWARRNLAEALTGKRGNPRPWAAMFFPLFRAYYYANI